MTIEDIKRTFRSPNLADYPELTGYGRNEIYENKMGPGGLFLAARMSRELNVYPGERVLDIGCGMGSTSAFLAKTLSATVFALDLWIPATSLHKNFQAKGVEENVIPLNLDITGTLPFAEGYFDAIFCMDAIHYFGEDVEVLDRIMKTLKPMGRLCVGSPCFNEEFSENALNNLPALYDDGSELWPQEFSRYHSPRWWAEQVGRVGAITVVESHELEDGLLYWQDDILHNIENEIYIDSVENDADQIMYRAVGMPYLTHFMLTAERMAEGHDQ